MNTATTPTGPEDAYKAPLREFLAANGRPVTKRATRLDWEDGEAEWHTNSKWGEGCTWAIAPGARLTEHVFSDWNGTFAGSSDEMAVDVTSATCTCGRYRDYTLRFVGSFGDVLTGALGTNHNGIPL